MEHACAIINNAFKNGVLLGKLPFLELTLFAGQACVLIPNMLTSLIGHQFFSLMHNFAGVVHNEDTTWIIKQIQHCLNVMSIFLGFSFSATQHTQTQQPTLLGNSGTPTPSTVTTTLGQ